MKNCGCGCNCHADEGKPEWPGACAGCCEPDNFGGFNCACVVALSTPPPSEVDPHA